MEIRRVRTGNSICSAAEPKKGRSERPTSKDGRPSMDQLELSRQWVAHMEEQSTLMQAQAVKKSRGSLSMLDQTGEQSGGQLDAVMKALQVQLKCAKIAAQIMAGKRVPQQDKNYLMKNDPEGYQLAILMRKKETDEKCESVLDEEDTAGEQSVQVRSGAASGEVGEPSPEESGPTTE